MAQAIIKYITIGAITAVDNYIDSVPGTISFSSAPTIQGDLSVVVITPGIEFSAPVIEIDGNFLILIPPPAGIKFSDPGITADGFSGIVEMVPPDIVFSSPALPLPLDTMVSVLPGGISLSSLDITIDGSQSTIFSEPGAFKMGVSAGIRVDIIEVSSAAMSAIFPPPPVIGFSAPVIVIDGNETIIIPPPGGIEFSDPGIAILSQVVTMVPAGMVFSDPGVGVGVYDMTFPGTKTVYKFVLTGKADGTTDIEIPISSFQTRIGIDTQSYLSVVIPGVEYADEISDRTNGTLVLSLQYVDVKYPHDVAYLEQIITVTFDDISIPKGPVNQSITLSGYESSTGQNTTQNSVILSDDWLNYTNTAGGKLTARLSKPHPVLKVGDIAVIDGVNIVVGGITWVKSATAQTIEITEYAS